MPITYDPSMNVITVTGYTESVPCTFDDLYDADKAGSLSLHHRDGITGTDPSPVDCDRNLRPTDEVLMGGKKRDLYIMIENWQMLQLATIRLIGTDENGNPLQEDMDVYGDGTYYASKLFKTLTQTQVVAFQGTSFDYELIQGQWGVIWRLGTTQFQFDCKIQIGDAVTETWFQDKNKTVVFSSGIALTAEYLIFVRKYATLIFGELLDEAAKITSNGVTLISLEETNVRVNIIKAQSNIDATLYLYSSMFSSPNKLAEIRTQSATGRIWNCTFLFNIRLAGCGANTDFYNLYLSNVNNALTSCSATSEKIFLTKCNSSIYVWADNPLNIKDAIIRGVIPPGQYEFQFASTRTIDSYLIDIDAEHWNFKWAGTSTGKVYRQYTFNLQLLDENGDPFTEQADVTLYDKDGNVVFSVQTSDIDGKIPEQTVTYGYYHQGYGDELQSYSPHTLEIKKLGYQTYKKKFYLDRKIDWKFKLSKARFLLTTLQGELVVNLKTDDPENIVLYSVL